MPPRRKRLAPLPRTRPATTCMTHSLILTSSRPHILRAVRSAALFSSLLTLYLKSLGHRRGQHHIYFLARFGSYFLHKYIDGYLRNPSKIIEQGWTVAGRCSSALRAFGLRCIYMACTIAGLHALPIPLIHRYRLFLCILYITGLDVFCALVNFQVLVVSYEVDSYEVKPLLS